jgi:hypothetical protein
LTSCRSRGLRRRWPLHHPFQAAAAAGRTPVDVRRLLNIGPQPVDELVRLALEDGIGTFILIDDAEAPIRAMAEEIAPAVREQVGSERSRMG